MTGDRGRNLFARYAAIAFVAVALGGCDLLTNADFLKSFRRDADPQASTPLSEQGLGKLAKGELVQANQLFERALQENPGDVYALLGRGIVLQRWGQVAQARQAYESVLALRPGEDQRLIVFGALDPRSIGEIANVNLDLLRSQGVITRLSGSGRDTGQGDAGGGQPSMAASQGAPSMRAASSGPAPAVIGRGDANVIARFETLAALRDRGLITPDEYAERRNANIGALLPLTAEKAPAAGLERPVPSAEQIVDRLNAIGRALEMRAINMRQHTAERATIVDGLLPASPQVTANPPPPPKELLEAADNVRRLEAIRERGLIAAEEYNREKEAIERALMPAPSRQTASGEGAARGPQAMAPGAQPSGPRPAVHIASFRSEQAAERGWAQLRRAHQNALGTLGHETVRVNLGAGKGVFYRLIAGPVASQAEAERICSALKQRRQFCETTFTAG